VLTAHARRTLEACAVEHSALLRGVQPGDVLVQVMALFYDTCHLRPCHFFRETQLLSASASCVVDVLS